MKGTLTAITVGDYVIDQMGFIENIDLSWNTDYPWATQFNNEDKGDIEGLETNFQGLSEFPTVLEVSINFKPIHQTTPSADRPRFIANKNKLYIQSPSADKGQK